jgi:hypothetical protein
MAMWKRLTQDLTVPVQIDINMATVAMIQREGGKNYTMLTFAFMRGQSQYTFTVKETPEEIHRLPPL